MKKVMEQNNAHSARYRFWEARFWEEVDPKKKIRISLFLAALIATAASSGQLIG